MFGSVGLPAGKRAKSAHAAKGELWLDVGGGAAEEVETGGDASLLQWQRCHHNSNWLISQQKWIWNTFWRTAHWSHPIPTQLQTNILYVLVYLE